LADRPHYRTPVLNAVLDVNLRSVTLNTLTGCTNPVFVSGGGRVPGSAVIMKYEICSGKYQLPTLIIIDLWVVYGMGS